LTQQDFLDLFDRIFPAHWIEPLKSPGPGYEVLQAYAQLFRRVSDAVCVLGRDNLITSAYGGTRATGEVEFYRSTPNSDGIDVVIKTGTIVTTSNGVDFLTIEDVTFLAADLGPKTVDIHAVAMGYEWNVPGVTITADGTSLPGEINAIKTLVEDPAYGDITFQVRQLLATSGGRDAALDQLGADRGISRYASEEDADYRSRIGALPDTVTPNAFSRACKRILDKWKAEYSIIETWDIAFNTCYDSPQVSIPGSNYDPTLACYDDPRSAVQYRNREMDESTMRGCTIVVVDNLQPILDHGFAEDDPAMDADGFISTITLGRRGLNAYDVPSTISASFIQGCYDGYDERKNSVYAGLWKTMQDIKPSGSTAILELKGQ
jgi:hypothetical protein